MTKKARLKKLLMNIFTGNGGTVVRNICVVHRARHSLSVPESDGTVVSGLWCDGNVRGSPTS